MESNEASKDISTEVENLSKSDNTDTGLGIKFTTKHTHFLSDAKDGRPPKCIYDAFNQYKPKSASEIMNILVHLSMLESGFKLSTEDNISSLPPSWRDIATTLKYSKANIVAPKLQNESDLSKYSPSEHIDFICLIALVTMGSTKQVLASFAGQDSEISVKFDTNQYIPKDSLEPEHLKRLSHFDCLFRNELLYPLRISAHNILGLPAPWHLIGLPYDIMLLILNLLPVKDILRLGTTCTLMKNTVDDNRVWFNLYKRDFSSQLKSTDSINSCIWKEYYKKAYLKQKNDEAASRSNENIIDDDPNIICDGLRHPIVPNFIGGPPGAYFDPPAPYIHPYGPPGAYFDPPAPSIHPYGPPGAIFPDGRLDPFGDPDGIYFNGELCPRRGRMPHNPYGPFFGSGGYGRRAGGRGGPRMHFI